MRRWQRFGWLLLPVVALLAVIPLMRNGCSCGHDFDFHILSWMEAASQFRHGNLHPQWAYSPAFNAGEPRFVFYPPLSWTIGAVLGLVMPWAWTPIAYTWIALTAAGLGCYQLLREFVPAGTAVAVAVMYIVNPYMLFTAYERTAYAELLAAAWLPLLLHGILRRRVTLVGLAVPVALLWLTNAPAAVIGCYGLAIVGTVQLVFLLRQDKTRAAELARNAVGGTALGIGLASFYIVPAAWERRFVEIQMALTDGMRIGDNFVFHRTPDADHDAVLRTASLLAVGLILMMVSVLVVGLIRWQKDAALQQRLISLTGLTGVITVLLLPVSAGVWAYAPELAFLQFPWRFLAILMPGLALALGLALPARLRVIVPLAVLALLVIAYPKFKQECDPEDTVKARLALYQSGAGTEATDEYTPVTADNDALGKANPAYWLAGTTSAGPQIGVHAGALMGPLELISARPQVLVLNLRDYPAWRIFLNGALVTKREPRNDGLMAVRVPAGRVRVDVVYRWMVDEVVGAVISGVALVLLAGMRRLR